MEITRFPKEAAAFLAASIQATMLNAWFPKHRKTSVGLPVKKRISRVNPPNQPAHTAAQPAGAHYGRK